ncbi:MAG: class I SAM-dependent methyltransferase [Mariprofundaceae bacterium]|nr:class I SAM-dependent methyltransferase [Mariprofundaceae bacterium]
MIELDPQQQEKMALYVHEVLRFRKALNLTSVDDEAEFYQRFIHPTLAMIPYIPRHHGRFLDIGSGMGVPGVPLMIAMPDMVGVLVERRKKRAEFLRHILRRVRLRGEVYDADVRHLPCLNIDLFTARAVTEPASLFDMCTPHANKGAVAVMPVSGTAPLQAHGDWKPVEHSFVDAVNTQQIQHYAWHGQEDVSRET